MSRSRRERWKTRKEEPQTEPPRPQPASPAPAVSADTAALARQQSAQALQAQARAAQTKPPPQPPPRPRSGNPACYVDFENVFFSAQAQRHAISVPRMVRHLNRLSREASGDAWTHTAVYANWDAIVPQARHAQDDWAMLGWRTIAVPTREDYVSQRTVKNLCDFVMSLDMLEDARDRDIDHFFVVSGDADFCEVVERLKRLKKRVTVCSLQPNLSWRLREAADDYIVWAFEDVTGDEPLPMQSYRRLAQVSQAPGRAANEDPFQVLMRAVRLAEKDQGVAPVSWPLVRDEYFLRMSPMDPADADRFVRQLADAGFVTLVRRRQRDGRPQDYVTIPH